MIKLRRFNASDTELLMEYLNNPEVTRYISGAIPKPYTKADAQWWVAHSETEETIKAIEYEGVLVGCISATRGAFEYSRSAELGYWVAEDYWNKGIATQAVKELSGLLFQTTDLARLFVSVVSLNGASIKVLEKNGYSLEGMLKKASYHHGRFYDEQLMSKVTG